MNRTPVISIKNTPNGYPFLATFVYVTALHYWNAPIWVIITLPSIHFLFFAIRRLICVEVDIFKDIKNDEHDDEQKKYQSKFSERLAQMAKEKGINTNK